MLKGAGIFSIMFATGCAQVYYPPPPQRSEQPHQIKEILDMTGGRPTETWGTVVSGVKDTGDPNLDWRWATERALFHFKLDQPEGWSLTAHMTAAQSVLNKTGPQRVTFLVNGQTAGTVTLGVSRRYDLSFPVNAALLNSSTPIVVEMDASPCLPDKFSPPFCVLLHSIGFEQEPH